LPLKKVSSKSGADHPASATIRQSWTRMSVTMDFALSRSRSLTGALLAEGEFGTELHYEYANQPKYTATESMHTHKGTCVLLVHDDRLEGDYYTGRDRMTFGSIVLRRTPKAV
jgi:hypothetical protein